MPRRNLVWLLGIASVSLFCWTVAQGSLAPPHGPLQFVKRFPGNDLKDYENLDLLVDALQHVEQSYVHELNAEERRKFIEHAIEGGLQSLDLHSGFIPPREFKQFRRTSEGSFGGIGVQIHVSRDTKKLTVVTPIVGTPAYQAGIKPGDEIEKIDGQPTQGMGLDEAVDKIQGPPGTEIRLTLRRGHDRLIDLTLKRSKIEVESILGDQRDANKQWELMIDKQNKIGYLRLIQFNRKSADELKQALQKLEKQSVRGLILDLRDNPGGLLDIAVDVADLFLEQGKVVSVEGRSRPMQVYQAKEDGTLFLPARDHPMIVLVNKSSASASEIVAAALQDHQRAVVIGERTFGKGSVQNIIEMESGKSAMKLTTAKYIRPNGKNIHRFPESKEDDDWGVRPNVTVKLSPQEELEWWQGRRDRDVVHSDNPAEKARRVAEVVAPLWTGWLSGQPLTVVTGAAESAAAYQNLPGSRRFVDKALDTALEQMREKLRETKTRTAAGKH